MPNDHTEFGCETVRPRFLPAPLVAARCAALNELNCLDLNMRARRVLFGILAFFNPKQSHRGIWPRRETLREESLTSSPATLYRGLADLERLGYITRLQIRLKESGRIGVFHISPIMLTEKALALLGLREVINNSPSSKMRDGSIYKERTKDRQSLQNTVCKQKASNSKTDDLDQRTKVPKDLVPLLQMGVSRPGVYWLMKQARLKGKRLSDVVAIVLRNLKACAGSREVVAYLMSMFKKNLDYAWLASKENEAAREKLQTEESNKKLEEFDDRYAGFEVVARNGRLVGVIESSGDSVQTMNVITPDGSIPINRRFIVAWMDGKFHIRAPM